MKGFRVILISDIQETPVIHMAAKGFAVTVTDWSTQLHASTVIPITIDYYNLKVSQWEPLIDPWKFSVTVRFMPSPFRPYYAQSFIGPA